MARSGPSSGDQVLYTRSVLNSLRRTVRAFRASAQAAEEVLGVSGAQHFVMQKLADAPALSLNDLAARTLTHKSSVSVVVSRLVERGYVRRERSSADGRSIVLTLTPAGRRALERIAVLVAEHPGCGGADEGERLQRGRRRRRALERVAVLVAERPGCGRVEEDERMQRCRRRRARGRPRGAGARREGGDGGCCGDDDPGAHQKRKSCSASVARR